MTLVHRNAAGRAALLFSALIAGACGSERRALTDNELAARAITEREADGRVFDNTVGKVIGRLERDPADALDILAMSGGGDYGAFGAGFLVGWGQAPDVASQRPEFDVVTGVSTGALLAPFAFIGTDESCQQIESLYRDPKRDWLRDRGLFFFWPSNPSFMELPGLERDVRAAVNADLIAQVAAESRKGRVLAVSATDCDYGRQKLWDVSSEAERATDEAGVDRVQRMLLASAAIPAVFPPIEIGDSVYADGGVTANVLLKLDAKSPNALIPRWRAAHPDIPLPRVRYWVIINNQLSQPPKIVQLTWPAIVGPSLATAIRSATIAEVRWLTAEADHVNAVLGTNIEVRVVAIPDDWRAPVEGDFKRETMNSLADLGRKLGSDPASWRLWTTPRRNTP